MHAHARTMPAPSRALNKPHLGCIAAHLGPADADAVVRVTTAMVFQLAAALFATTLGISGYTYELMCVGTYD